MNIYICTHKCMYTHARTNTHLCDVSNFLTQHMQVDYIELNNPVPFCNLVIEILISKDLHECVSVLIWRSTRLTA